MTSKMRKAVIVLILMLGSVVFAYTNDWQRFSSSSHFSVSYPGSWFRTGVSTDRLQLLSSKGGTEGIRIKQGQAEITVVEAPGSSTQTLAEVIAYYTQDLTILSSRDIPVEGGEHACNLLKEITSEEPAIPPGDSPINVPMIINTDFFCEVDGHKIVTLLRNWKGDKREQEYQQVALRMARGIRIEMHP